MNKPNALYTTINVEAGKDAAQKANQEYGFLDSSGNSQSVQISVTEMVTTAGGMIANSKNMNITVFTDDSLKQERLKSLNKQMESLVRK